MRRVAAVLLATCVLAVTLGRAEGTVRAYTPQSWAAAVRPRSAPLHLPRLTLLPVQSNDGKVHVVKFYAPYVGPLRRTVGTHVHSC